MKKILEDDLIVAGFKKIEKINVINPPKINWGMIYKEKTADEKIEYLEKLASSMNHAAKLIQDERNELGRLCELKETQLTKMNASLIANNNMIQQEITKMNLMRQDYNEQIKTLSSKIRELEKE